MSPMRLGSIAQLGERLPCKQDVVGSSPIRSTICAVSSVGRASALQAGGRRFEPYTAHQIVGSIVRENYMW